MRQLTLESISAQISTTGSMRRSFSLNGVEYAFMGMVRCLLSPVCHGRSVSVLSAPDYHMLGGLAAAHANVGDMLLVKGYAAGFDSAGIVLYLVLTLGISAPHGFDEAGLVRGDVKELFIVMSDARLSAARR